MSTSTLSYSDIRATRRALRLKINGPVAFGLLIALVLLVTAVPYALAYRGAPAGWHFMGILLNVPDTAQYLSWARESSHSFLIENKLTSERGAAVYFNVFFLIVGHIASWLHIGYAEALQVMRLLSGAVYLGAIYWFTGLFLSIRVERWTAALMAIFGAGLGWILVIQKVATHAADVAFPLDIYVSEANAFLSVLAFSLQAMASGLVVIIIGLASIALERRSFPVAVGAGLLALFLGAQHGYDLLVIYGVVGLVTLLLLFRPGSRIRLIALAACICCLSLPTALWSVAITQLDPTWRATLSQYGNAGVFTPSLPHLVILMGLPLVLSAAGLLANARADSLARLVRWQRTMPTSELLLVVWAVLALILIYVPTSFQIKMFVAWQVPLSILATRTVARACRALAPRVAVLRVQHAPVFVAAIIVLFTIPTNAYLLGWRIIDLQRHDYPYFLRTDDIAALQWLETNGSSTNVLSSLVIGQYVPSVSGNNAFLGHWADTTNFYQKEQDVALFFDASTPEWFRQAILERYAIGYVFYGNPERALGQYDPGQSPLLREVFSTSTVKIYQVVTK